jgi:hypothetical protein
MGILQCRASVGRESEQGFFIFLGRNTPEYREWTEFAQSTGARHLASVFSELAAPKITVQQRDNGVIEAVISHRDRQRSARMIADSCRPLLKAIHSRLRELNAI